MYSCHSIPECCVMFYGVKLSIRSFVLFKSMALKVFRFSFQFTLNVINLAKLSM